MITSTDAARPLDRITRITPNICTLLIGGSALKWRTYYLFGSAVQRSEPLLRPVPAVSLTARRR